MTDENQSPPEPRFLRLKGILLFLFIPTVLFLLLQHPEPIALSAGLAVGLMIGHRFLARPYMEAALAKKCLWCNRLNPEESSELELAINGGARVALVCVRHAESLARFFTFTHRMRHLLRLGIFAPLLVLLFALCAAAMGRVEWLATAVSCFRVSVAMTVLFAASCYWRQEPSTRLTVAFPLHNFSLLGVGNILWIFRLVGVIWLCLEFGALRGRGY